MHTTAVRVGISGLCLCLYSLSLSGRPAEGAGIDNPALQDELRQELRQRVLPYWYDTAIDHQHGGFVLADRGTGEPDVPEEKQLVSQARMIWGFSLAHTRGWSDSRRDYLKAAEQGSRFLLNHFRDDRNGGYFWSTDLTGQPRNRNKIMYGQAFVIYGLVELHRAGGSREPLDRALELYRKLQQQAYDREHGGWIEHFTSEWTPILKPAPGAIVEVAGYKSANTHLHLMEAFTELYEATRDPAVRNSLEEALRLNQKYFYPRRAEESCFHRQRDWKPVTDPASAGLSYGHNVEFAWLMIRAERVLGRRPSWRHFYAHLDHALKCGYDHEHGGTYSRGVKDEPATDTDKVWWVQSEMLAALTDAWLHKPNPRYGRALDSQLDFIRQHQADPRTRVWRDTVRADGSPKAPSLAHNWKANYHDVRAVVKFIEAAPQQKTTH